MDLYIHVIQGAAWENVKTKIQSHELKFDHRLVLIFLTVMDPIFHKVKSLLIFQALQIYQHPLYFYPAVFKVKRHLQTRGTKCGKLC